MSQGKTKKAQCHSSILTRGRKLDVSEQNDSLKTSLFPFLVIVLFFYAGQFWINQLRCLVPSRGSGILSETWMSCSPDSTRTEIQSLPKLRHSFMQQGSIFDIPAIWAENRKEKQMEMNWQRQECHLSNSPSLPPEGRKKTKHW